MDALTKVLDDGYVELVSVMGSDRAIAEAAWISTDAEHSSTVRTDEEVRRVIRYMMRHRHTSPFEMAEMKFRVRVPMDVWRQWIRHRTANVNEYSTRYSEAIDSAHMTRPTQWRLQSTGNHQGSSGFVEDAQLGVELSEREKAFHHMARTLYRHRLDNGVAREQARKDLPLSTYTEAFWKCDLHNIFHFLSLRLDSHAQLEIRQYAEAIEDFVMQCFPIAHEAFYDYQVAARTFSRMEMDVLRQLVVSPVDPELLTGLTKRERNEFLADLEIHVKEASNAY